MDFQRHKISQIYHSSLQFWGWKERYGINPFPTQGHEDDEQVNAWIFQQKHHLDERGYEPK